MCIAGLARWPLASRYTSLVLSMVVAFIAWQWLVERAEALALGRWPHRDYIMGAARVLSVLLILGGVVCWIVGRRGRAPSAPS